MFFETRRSREDSRRGAFLLALALLLLLPAGALRATGLREELPERPEPSLREPPAGPLPARVVRVALVPPGPDESSLEAGVRQALDDQNTTLSGGERMVLFQKDAPPRDALDIQINLVERAVAGGAHVILLNPLDPRGLVAAVERARAAGVLVVTLMNPLERGASFHVGTDASAASGSVVEHLLRYRGTGPVALFSGPEGAPPSRDRARQVLGYLEEHHPEVRILEPLPSGPVSLEAVAVATRSLVAATPDLAGIIATDSISLEGAARGVREAGAAGRVVVAGFDKTPGTKALLEEGVIRGILVEDPFAIGYVALVRAAAALRGSDVPEEIFLPYRMAGP
ncbi:hypothetical protein AU468_11865 [Alkalispirochaeta sphaeroplastigenens]|uniref:Periplasmic binding protein domain-containing protein n=1 Tax=Alkalispirochaeta sphaeroplastigenens TaxID=1187066 RepID=A0A2S4JGS9_9SPIO|nr:substrate-binding domain-containing protein [Alkalispirochaeta sphaeroplastigenens]POQ98731.1 hypothetical protein AU468_11865 [Alkalispirochaeta sphaeroplastigenens]